MSTEPCNDAVAGVNRSIDRYKRGEGEQEPLIHGGTSSSSAVELHRNGQ